MNRISIFVFIFCCLHASVLAATWKTDTASVSGAKITPAPSPNRYWDAYSVSTSGTVLGYIPMSGGGGQSVGDSALTGPLGSVTLTQDFYIVWGQAPHGTLTNQQRFDAMMRMGWISSYQVGGDEPQQSDSGPYDGSGQPVHSDGSPADPATSSPTIKSYKASITVAAPASSFEPKTFRVLARNALGEIIHEDIATVNPGESRTITVTADQPFVLSATEVLQNVSFDPELSPGTPSDENRWIPVGSPVNVNAAPQTADPPIAPRTTDEKTAQAPSTAQSAAQKNTISTAATGTTSKDISDLSNNLSNELQRVTNQVQASGDAMKSSIDAGTKELKKLNDGTGDGSSGAALPEANAGAASFSAGVGAKVEGLGAALTGLVNAAGLGADPGTNPLTWQFPDLNGGTVDVTLEPYSDIISSVRSVELWLLEILFLWMIFGIMRGAFVDEGK